MDEDNLSENIIDIPLLEENKSEIFSLVEIALERGASDLILSMGNNPYLRIEGKLFPILEKEKLTHGYIEKLIDLLVNERQANILKASKELDFSYIFRDQAFLRINVFYQRNSLAAVFRVIPAKIRDFDELNLPSNVFKSLVQATQGLILVSGASGSGKSTSIAAMIEEINKTRSEYILTIEDPIEYVFKNKQSIINQREVGRDTASFKNALKSAIRENFNIVFIGELRDMESIEAALDIAETGHLVFATIHSMSAISAPNRIINIFPPHYQTQIRNQLSNVLLGVVAQKLMPKMDGGRIPAVEILIANQAVRSVIRIGDLSQLKNIIETSKNDGMVSLEQAIKALQDAGKIIGK